METLKEIGQDWKNCFLLKDKFGGIMLYIVLAICIFFGILYLINK